MAKNLKNPGIVLALDEDNEEIIKVKVKKILRYIEAIKVGYPLVLSMGMKVIKKLSSYKPVIADFKIADVPHIASKLAEAAFEWGASAVISHGFTGSDSVKAVLEVASKYDGEVYVVTELSSPGGREFMAGVSEEIAEMAKKIGCHGIIAPATRPERIKRFREIVGNLKIFSPGVGVQGGNARETIEAGADFLIVGRSIYEGDVERNIKDILRTIKI